MFVKAFLHERQGEWLDGIASAFRHFAGVPVEVLGDNSRCLVIGRNREAQTVTFHPAYLAFCRDWDVQPRACQPYRARTKGKTESGVKYVKRNGIAGRQFESFAHLEAHLAEWQLGADQRVLGTTHERPVERFERPLPARPLPTHGRKLQRRVANDAFVDIDTVRYSVPHRLVRARSSVRTSPSGS
jgi:transposase